MSRYGRLCSVLQCLSAACALSLLGCQAGLPAPPADVGDPITSKDELFSLDHLPAFYIELDDEAYDELKENPKLKYVSGTFRYRDQYYDNVGVRLKGNLSFAPIDEKPAFKIKFNEFVKGERFLDLEGLTLNNMRTDSSMLREWLSYRIFREAGNPASRAGFATVYLNDEYYGIYLNLEKLDDSFLEDNFKNPKGNLYEGEHGDDLDRDPSKYEQDEGEDTSLNDLRDLMEFATRDNADIFFADDTPLAVDEFINFMAAEVYIGQFDGYWTSHNYFLYNEPTLNKWYFMPWSLDQVFRRELNPFKADGFLSIKCREDQRCLEELLVPKSLELSEMVQELELGKDASKIIALTEQAARADTHKRHSNESMEKGWKQVHDWLEKRPANFEEHLDCLVDGKEPDEDGDGHGICFKDCNDDDDSINVGAEEKCDEIDNDCSEFIDDDPACPCESHEVGGKTFYFCTHVFGWKDAREFCWDQGHELAHFEDRTQNDEVWTIASSIQSGRWAIGLNDRDEENDYRWLDGSEPSFTAWDEGQPAHTLDWFDCVFFRGSDEAVWQERNCSATGAFICSEVDEEDDPDSENPDG